MNADAAAPTPCRRRSLLARVPEAGLCFVILALGVLLTLFGGTVKMPKFETGADGQRQRVFTINAAGERTLVLEEKNKFLNAQNLTQLAKPNRANS